MGSASLRHAFVLSVLLVAPSLAAAQPGGATSTPAPATPASLPHDNGLLLEIRIDTSRSMSPVADAPGPRGALFLGYHLRRWSVGLGFELARTSRSTDDTTTVDDQTDTTHLISPGVRVALGRSADGRAEVFAQLDLGFGETLIEYNDQQSADALYERFRLQIGPGLRYWISESFALGAAALLRHDRVRHERNFSTTVEETSSTDLATSLTVTGVF